MSWKTERARVASLTRSRPDGDPDLLEARRSLKAARLVHLLTLAVQNQPLLSRQQLDEIAAVLDAGGAQ